MKLRSPYGKLVSTMARRKIVFVIVEGPADSTALGLFLEQFYSPERVHVHIVHGDITTRSGNIPSNILKKVAAEIQEYARDNHLKSLHFQEIIHLVDTDGAYVPDDAIIEDDSVVEVLYSETEIRTVNKTEIINRNAQKRANIDKLSTTNEIWGLPYHVYYMSCNLDHVLYNKLNTSDEEKKRDAHQFGKFYRDRLSEFITFISESEFSVTGEYNKSWEFIKEEKHSLERYTNMGLSFSIKEEPLVTNQKGSTEE